MVEKAGHKKQITLKRMDWINDGKPKPWEADEDKVEQNIGLISQEADKTNSAPAVLTTAGQQLATPEIGDVPDEDDIYGATPVVQVERREEQRLKHPPKELEDDDLDALMAEADAATQAQMLSQQELSVKSVLDDFADEEAALAEMDGLW